MLYFFRKGENMENLNLIPNMGHLWVTLGYHFENLCQVMHEFIDNAISDFIKNKIKDGEIIITFRKIGNKVEVIIEDHGKGIIDIENALTLGGRRFWESIFNEHGNGIKHSLSCVDPLNKTWSIMTRTIKDALLDQYKVVKAPYSLENTFVETYKGNCLTGSETGTIIKFTCTYDIFKTIRIPFGSHTSQFKDLMELLYEDLGVYYSYIIEQDNVKITLKAFDDDKDYSNIANVRPIFPVVEKYKIDKSQMIDLGNGVVKIDLRYIIMSKNISTKKYYLKNMRSSGVEIRINGRLLEHLNFEEIWGLKSHPFYNGHLVIVNLISDERGRFPNTRTTKTGLNRSDSKTAFLFHWIADQISLLHDEKEMNQNIKMKFIDQVVKLTSVSQENIIYDAISTKKFICNCQVCTHEGYDLYFECIKTKVNDLYFFEKLWDEQLLLNKPIGRIILIADEHPEPVRERVRLINKKNIEGKNYNIVLIKK